MYGIILGVVITIGFIAMIVAYVKTEPCKPYSIIKATPFPPELIVEEEFPKDELVLIEYDIKGEN